MPTRTRASLLLVPLVLLLAACGRVAQVGPSLGQPSASVAPSGSVAPPASAPASPGASGSVPPLRSAAPGTSPGASPGTSPVAPSAPTGPTFGDIPGLIKGIQPSVVTVVRPDGEGSGVVWSADGLIVTNNHVVQGVDRVDVVFADKKRAAGQVLATDPATDLALVRVQRTGLPAATFRDGLPQVGELAIAIGAPLGFEESATAGIVSGTGRDIPGSAQVSPALIDLLQTDAAISPGNSGGALVGGDGRVMGINVAYLPPQTGAVALGFAIPSPTVIDVVTQLAATGRVAHAYLGIAPVTLDPQTAQAYGLPVQDGVIVAGVAADGPAAQAGIQAGDIITSFDGTRLTSAEDLLHALREKQPGETATLTVVRQGEGDRTVTAELGELPTTRPSLEPPPSP